MQKVGHTYKNIHPIFDELERLYKYLISPQEKRPLIKPVFDKSLEGLLNLLDYCGIDVSTVQLVDKHYTKLKTEKFNSKNMIVLFSGGKDSISCALHYKKLGYNVYLYHIKGYNNYAPDEWKFVEKIADYMQLPLHIESLNIPKVKNHYQEIPLIDALSYVSVLNWSVNNGIGLKIATGDFQTTALSITNEFLSGIAGGTREFVDANNEILKKYIGAKIYRGNYNNNSSFKNLLSDKKLLELSISCISPHRFREMNRTRIQSKYGVKLMEHRCGYCWKCCDEYIYYADRGILEYNREYYIHCLNSLLKNELTEMTSVPETIEQLWYRFLFYPIQKSKMYPEILDLKIKNGKVHV